MPVGYDSKTKTLEVIFTSGRIYLYDGVPAKVYKDLLAATSKGQFMRYAIIGAYPYREFSRR